MPDSIKVKTNIIVHAPVIGLDLTSLRTKINEAIKHSVGPKAPSYFFDSNVVIEIPTSSQPVRIFPSTPIDEAALYVLADISYEYCSGMVSMADKLAFYVTVPNAIRDTIQMYITGHVFGMRVGIGSINFSWDAFCKMSDSDSFDFEKRTRFIEEHLVTLLPQLRSKL